MRMPGVYPFHFALSGPMSMLVELATAVTLHREKVCLAVCCHPRRELDMTKTTQARWTLECKQAGSQVPLTKIPELGEQTLFNRVTRVGKASPKAPTASR
jgi:hypothetical protein